MDCHVHYSVSWMGFYTDICVFKRKNIVLFNRYPTASRLTRTRAGPGGRVNWVLCDAGQCTNDYGFNSGTTCARLLGAFMLCVGFPQHPLRLSSSSLNSESLVSVLRSVSVAPTVLQA